MNEAGQASTLRLSVLMNTAVLFIVSSVGRIHIIQESVPRKLLSRPIMDSILGKWEGVEK